MKFKQWLLSESQWVTLSRPTRIDGIKCDKIDFRFEDYSIDGGNALQFMKGCFSAPLKDGRWLNFTEYKADASAIPPDMDYATYKAMRQRGEVGSAFGQVPSSQINIMDEPIYPRKLPDNWADYAILFLGDYVQKGPKHPRGTDPPVQRLRKQKHGRLPVQSTLPVQPVQSEPIFAQ
jgi:hypothetical protein